MCPASSENLSLQAWNFRAIVSLARTSRLEESQEGIKTVFHKEQKAAAPWEASGVSLEKAPKPFIRSVAPNAQLPIAEGLPQGGMFSEHDRICLQWLGQFQVFNWTMVLTEFL